MRTTIKPLLLTALFCLAFSTMAQAGTTSYQYDDLHRLSRVQRPDGTVITYTYDALGNRTNKTVAPPADTTPPRTTITAHPANPTKSTSATLKFTSNENGSFLCKLDTESAFIACGSPKDYTGLGAGSHTFSVKAIDLAGNADGSPATYTWTIDTTLPVLGTLTPTPITTQQGRDQTFTATYSAMEGFANLGTVELLARETLGAENSIHAKYDNTSNLLSLYNDAGTTTLGTCAPMSAGVTISNTQGTLNCGKTTVTKAENSIIIKWSIKPSLRFASAVKAKKLYLKATDKALNAVGWTQKGTWKIMPGNLQPGLGALTPAKITTLAGAPRSFKAVYTDPDGYTNLKFVELQVGTTVDGSAAIWARYDLATNKLTLYNNAGTAPQSTSCQPNTAGTRSNAQGALNCLQTTVSKTGNTLTVNWNISPVPGYIGTKTIKMRATDNSKLTTGLVAKGTWAITSPAQAARALQSYNDTYTIIKYGFQDGYAYANQQETVLVNQAQDLIIKGQGADTATGMGGELSIAVRKAPEAPFQLSGRYAAIEQAAVTSRYEFRFIEAGVVEVIKNGGAASKETYTISSDGWLTIGALSGQLTSDSNTFVLSGSQESPAIMIGTRQGDRPSEVGGAYEGVEVLNRPEKMVIQPKQGEGIPSPDAVISKDGELYLEADTDNSDEVTGFSVLQRAR